MKMKRFMFTASSIAVGASLVGSILTSCSKATVEEKNKISLDDNGGLCNEKTAASFKDALKDALSRSSNWTTFKAALADEIVYRWYVDRAAENKDSNTKNPTFRVNLDEWTDKIKKDYEETIKNLKNKYTDNWEFYLQNEILDPLGGTEDAYKHAKLVEKARAEFISKVFATNYFGYRTGDAEGDRARYEHIYSPASLNISEDKLKDPSTWSKLGFWATTNTSFAPGTGSNIDGSFLAKNPDGDYATIQNYVFDRWFRTEKPFFSAASLFKYSNPKYVAESKLSGIYDGVSTGVKIPDNPNEAFPFFGAYPSSESAKGTNAYIAWCYQLLKDGFDTAYDKDGNTNGTISIKKTLTEDSQTLLLSFGSQMIGGSANALYIPYANAAASLYLQMITGDATYKPLNEITQEQIAESVEKHIKAGQFNDGSVILENFMYTDEVPEKVTSYIDLNNVYPSGMKEETVKGGTEKGKFYHCPLFKDDDDYKFLHGETGTNGVRYITNTVQTELGKIDQKTGEIVDTQPWIFELNEAGMHAQTIDGYRYVVKQEAGAKRQEALKEVLKYRLMQKKCGYNSDIISGDVFGDSGKLKSYFSDNFTNIVLEIAFSGDDTLNIFRPIDGYKDKTEGETFENTLFLAKICTDEKLSNYKDIVAYIEATQKYDEAKKYIDQYETANNKTYAYRTKQMENAKTVEQHRTVYENGLLAPLAYSATTPEKPGDGVCARIYNTANITMLDGAGTLPAVVAYTRDNINELKKKVTETALYTSIDSLSVNQDNALSPQVSTAKSKTSNRFWYKSYIVDKMMYSYMSNKDGMANFIKGSAMQQYMTTLIGDDSAKQEVLGSEEIRNAFLATYGESKLFTNDRNYAYFGKQDDKTAEAFYTNLITGFNKDYEYKISTTGEHCDEYLNLKTYMATLTYLIGKEKNFENFYKILTTKISEDEMALVGYVNKTNKNIWNDKEFQGQTIDVNKQTENLTTDDFIQYDWVADVNNIFDKTGYTSKTETDPEFKDAWITCDQYWKVINKSVGPTDSAKRRSLAGFTGLQTKSSNQLDSASKLQSAAFDNFAKCSDASLVLSNDDAEKKFRNPEDENRYDENYGCWFAYAGTYEYNGDKQVYYTFPEVKYGEKTIKPDDFKIGDSYYPALKLGKRIAEYRSIDDLRDLAKKLGAAFYGDSVFRQIGDGTKKINNIDELKVTMLEEILKKSDGTNFDYLKCFQRMTDVELHEEGSATLGGKDYGFTDDKGNTFRILMTQINKADVTEKHFEPKWDAQNKKWVANDNSPIQIEEFWYILSNMATESSVQQMAIADVVKTVYGDDKLVVYDAQLYNCFDSVWIKDWSKKTMGA